MRNRYRFTDMFDNLLGRVPNDVVDSIEDEIDREIINDLIEDVRHLIIPDPPIDPDTIEDDDEENENDMYLTRIGYLKEEKKPEVKTNTGIGNADNTVNYWMPPAGIRRGVTNGIMREVDCSHLTSSFIPTPRQDLEEELDRVYHDFIDILYSNNFHQTLDGHVIEGILLEWKRRGRIDRFSIDRDYLEYRYSIIIEKRGYRKVFYISINEIDMMNHRLRG